MTKHAQLDEAIETWQKLARLAACQEEAIGHWQRALLGAYAPQAWVQLAPTWLKQTINPWSFSLVNFIGETKGDAELEAEILTRVAGYGSQLGTLIDAFAAIAPTAQERAQLPPDAQRALLRLELLAADIEKLKQRN